MAGFVKDAMANLFLSLQRRVDSLERVVGSGKILPLPPGQLTVTATTPPGALSFAGEYYRHNDFLHCWFKTSIPANFDPGNGGWYIGLPWSVRQDAGALLGRWRANDASSGLVAEGQIFAAGGNSIYLWYLNGVAPATHIQITNNTPWIWGVGDFLEGEFSAHILAGF